MITGLAVACALVAEPRHFVVTGGTGRYAGATGSGSVKLNVLDAGASETLADVIVLARRHSPGPS